MLQEVPKFFIDIVVPVKTVHYFAKNKPWIISNVKDFLNKKKRVFKDKNQVELRNVQRELRLCLHEAKESYRRKVEKMLQKNNMREVLDGMKTITGCKQRNGSATDGNVERVNEFSLFYISFDCPDKLKICKPSHHPQISSLPGTCSHNFCLSSHHPLTSLQLLMHPSPRLQVQTMEVLLPLSPISTDQQPLAPQQTYVITANQVRRMLRRLCPRKATNLDKVGPNC